MDPSTYEEAVKDPKWKDAMKEELDSIHRNGTWELLELPSGRKLIGLKWVFRTKYQVNVEVLRFKA